MTRMAVSMKMVPEESISTVILPIIMRSLELMPDSILFQSPKPGQLWISCYDRFNIYTVFTFGPQDNLGQPMKASERPGAAQEQPTESGSGTGYDAQGKQKNHIDSEN